MKVRLSPHVWNTSIIERHPENILVGQVSGAARIIKWKWNTNLTMRRVFELSSAPKRTKYKQSRISADAAVLLWIVTWMFSFPDLVSNLQTLIENRTNEVVRSILVQVRCKVLLWENQKQVPISSEIHCEDCHLFWKKIFSALFLEIGPYCVRQISRSNEISSYYPRQHWISELWLAWSPRWTIVDWYNDSIGNNYCAMMLGQFRVNWNIGMEELKRDSGNIFYLF